MNKNNKLTLSLLSLAVLYGCAVGKDYERPKMDLPGDWSTKQGNVPASAKSMAAEAQPASAVSATPVPERQTGAAGERWWSLYADPVLDRLEDEARAHNTDVQVAIANVLAARAQLGITEGSFYPSATVNARESRTKMTGVGTFPLPATAKLTQNLTHVTLDASYELDLWGKFRRATESAKASVLSAEASRDAAYLSLSAQVAQQYFALLSFDAQEQVLRRQLAGRQEMIALDRKKVEAGIMSDYDMHQAEADEASIRSQLASLLQARDRQETALAVLLGRSPRDVMSSTVDRGTPALANVWVPEGLPSELLLRRPDVQAAEMNLVALNAQIGVARAQYYPSLSLTGYAGSESTALAKLFTGPANIFQFAAGISQPITNLFRPHYLERVAEANRDAAVAQYQRAVANAFGDVRNALSAQNGARQILEAETARSNALSEAYRQAELRYRVGLSSRLEVLDVEKNYLQADLNRIDAQRAQRFAVADLFKAMGGGWQASPDGAKSGSPAGN